MAVVAIGSAQRPGYLEIPPLFGTVIKGLSVAGLTENARVVVDKPIGHDLASARALAADIHQYIHGSQLYRIDHYLGKIGLDELLYLRFANTMLEPQSVTLDMEFAQEGGEAPTPYEVLLQAAMDGDRTPFTRQDGVEEAWRAMAPLLEAPPPVHPYTQATWGPDAADHLLAGSGRWHEPRVAS